MAMDPAWQDFYHVVDEAALQHLDLLAELLPGGHWEGREYRCGSLNGEPGDSFGFNRDTGVWKDFANGEKGGSGFTSLYARSHGIRQSEAVVILGRRCGIEIPKLVSVNGSTPGGAAKPKKAAREAKVGWHTVTPFADALKPQHWDGLTLPPYQPEWGEPVAGWLYLDEAGRPWNYRIRFEKPAKEPGAKPSKEVRPLSWCKDERGALALRWKAEPAPRPLWNLEKLTAEPDKPVVVVEGEPTADAVERLFGLEGFVVTTWSGGADGEGHANWKPLIGRQTPIYLWPDNDTPGRDAMGRIADRFPLGADVRVVTLDPDWPEKYDLADLEADGWTSERASAWLHEHAVVATAPVTPDNVRPRCDMNGQDHGMRQERVWQALAELNRKADGPFYFFWENGKSGELKAIRPNRIGDRTLTTLNPESLCALTTKDLYFYATNSTMGDHAVTPDQRLFGSLMAAPSDGLPRLNRFTRTPVFAADRRLIHKPGYDRLSGIFYAPAFWARNVRIIERPTEADMVKAKGDVEDILTDFKFDSDADKANAYALMLLPILRELIDGPTPMHRVEAPAFGTGKTLLLSILLLPTIDNSQWLPETRDDEEWRKMLVTALRDGWPAIIFDNVRSLNSPVLNSFLTAPLTWGARPLHEQDIPQYKIRAVLACTVNNPVWNVEIHRRMETIRLNANVENPYERTGSEPGKTWKHADIKKHVERNRAKILSALLTMAQYGLEHPREFKRTKGSFEAWAQVMGPIMTALGFASFLSRSDASTAVDVEQDGLSDLLEAWETKILKDIEDGKTEGERLKREATTGDLLELALSLDTLTLQGRSESERKQALKGLLRSIRDQVKRNKVLRVLKPVNGKAMFRLEKLADA